MWKYIPRTSRYDLLYKAVYIEEKRDMKCKSKLILYNSNLPSYIWLLINVTCIEQARGTRQILKIYKNSLTLMRFKICCTFKPDFIVTLVTIRKEMKIF